MSKRKVTFQDGDEEFSLDDEVPTKKVSVCLTSHDVRVLCAVSHVTYL